MQIDLEPKEWKAQTEKPKGILGQMWKAHKEYKAPPVTVADAIWLGVVLTAVYIARHGLPPLPW